MSRFWRAPLCLAMAACDAPPDIDRNVSDHPPGPTTSLPPGASSMPSAGVRNAAPAPTASGTVSPEDMVVVPAGPFTMGCIVGRDDECSRHERPQHEVELDTFFIDRTEVTVDDYRRCHDAGGCSTSGLGSQIDAGGLKVDCNWDKGRGEHPINCIDWAQASAYCAWSGKRLPSEAEWEKAARGTDQRIYPWGSEAPSPGTAANLRVVRDTPKGAPSANSTWPVGSFPAGGSLYGALDMVGNVWEWTADWFDGAAYSATARRNPKGPPTGTARVVRGDIDPGRMRVTQRNKLAPTARLGVLGFRCAR